MLVAFVAAGLVAAFAYVSVAHKSYSAEADLFVTPVAPDDPNLIGLSLVRETADPTADVLTVAKLVDSPNVASLVAKRLGSNPNALLSHVSATPVTQSEIIAVQATASTPGRAAQLANAFANETVRARTNAMHAQIATLVPTLKAGMRGLAPADRTGLASQLAVLETLRASPDPTLRLSSPATPPTSPSSPNRKLSIAGGGFAGLIVGLLIVLAVNALDPKLRDEDQLREIYDLPLLVRVPKQRSGRSPLTPRELTPPVSEAFRTLRAAFTVRASERKRGAKRGQAILITGDAAADGKTTVALNLAASLTAAGKQVIVIEADLRRPSIGRALRVRAPRGIAEVLLGKAELVEALVWLRQYGPNLELLLGTTEDAREIDKISPESARRLVQLARSLADFVVIDSPPIPDVTDALAFAEEADDVVLVARVGNSHVRKMSDLGEFLMRADVVPTGVVLVGASERSGYYYYGGQKDQAVFAGLLQRRTRDERDIPVLPHIAGDREGGSDSQAAVPVGAGRGSKNGVTATSENDTAASENGSNASAESSVSSTSENGVRRSEETGVTQASTNGVHASRDGIGSRENTTAVPGRAKRPPRKNTAKRERSRPADDKAPPDFDSPS
jgi:Mrp family chromosome partitioning ATPase/capsular polysaccharide biosynthesis protein